MSRVGTIKNPANRVQSSMITVNLMVGNIGAALYSSE
jgi:hypothetical protein